MLDWLLSTVPRFAAVLAVALVVGVVTRLWKSRAAVGEGQPGVAEAVKALRSKDWERLTAHYVDRPPADRYHFLQGLAQASKLDGALPPKPQGDLAIIAAGLCLGWAWRHRGGGLGSSVSARGGAKMVEYLSRAEILLEGLGEAADSVSAAIGIRVAMGLNGSRGALQRYLNLAERRRERNIFVPRNHVMFVAPKWHGSIDEMFEVAREYAASAPNAAWIALVAMAHAESLLYRLLMNEDAGDRAAAHDYYINSDEYLRELEALDDAFWLARGKESLGVAEQIFAHNMMGYVLYRRGLMGRLARHLDAVGPDLTEIPWAYSGLGVVSEGVVQRLS